MGLNEALIRPFIQGVEVADWMAQESRGRPEGGGTSCLGGEEESRSVEEGQRSRTAKAEKGKRIMF